MDLSKYYKNNLCAGCDSKIDWRPTSTAYCHYTMNAEERFGKKLIRFCEHCWSRNCETCHDCHIPFAVAFSSVLGDLIRAKTSMVSCAPGSDHVCRHCQEQRAARVAKIQAGDDDGSCCPKCGTWGERTDDPNCPEIQRLACSTPPTLPPWFVEHLKCDNDPSCPPWSRKNGKRGPPDEQSVKPVIEIAPKKRRRK